jgi:hypothetical protein
MVISLIGATGKAPYSEIQIFPTVAETFNNLGLPIYNVQSLQNNKSKFQVGTFADLMEQIYHKMSHQW